MPEAGPGLVLVGLPGSGKSVVGRLVAERLGRPFRDSDEIIASRTGMPAASYLAQRGEEAFREAERAALAEACAERGTVVATGGGAPIDPLNRWHLWSHGRSVWLRAGTDTLLARLAPDPTPRPLLAGKPADRLHALEAERAPFYRAADVTVDAEPAPRTVAEAVVAACDRPPPVDRRLFDSLEPRHHPMGPPDARIVLGAGMDGVLRELLTEIGGTPALLVDRRVSPPPVDGAARCLLLPGGERVKRMHWLERIHAWLAAQGAERGDPLVSVGGGTVGDLAGLAAALYARGVPYVSVPTSWLAQVDASLGGKVAIDVPAGKNLVGAFWPAWAVLADVRRLRTLPRARLRDGLAEAVKAGIIGDPALWRLIDRRGVDALRGDEAARHAITERAALVKLAIVRRDPFERGERRVLNLGHTIGHALEAESGYRIAHGAAVALGMRAACSLAAGRGGDPRLAPALDDLLERLGFRLRHRFDPGAVRRATMTDKKRLAGRQRWLLPMAIGRVVEVDDVGEDELGRALRAIGRD